MADAEASQIQYDEEAAIAAAEKSSEWWIAEWLKFPTITQDEDAALIVESLNRGYRSTPTILIDDDHVATEPSRARLAQLFGVPDDSASYSPLRLLRRR